MAAPMNTARIGLSFDKSSLENSWFLVDFSKHSRVEDVSNEIKNQFFNETTYCEQRVILRINNFLLPPSASSELFRENDIVTVRLESRKQDKTSLNEQDGIQKFSGKWVHSSSDVISRQSNSDFSVVEVEDSGHKRKRRHSESDSRAGHKSSKHKKKKHKKRSDAEEDIEQSQTESMQNNVANKKSKEEGKHTKSTDKIECSASTSYERIHKREAKNDQPNDKMDQKIVKIKKKSTKDDLKHTQPTNGGTEVDIDSELNQYIEVDMIENENGNTTGRSVVNDDASSHSDDSLVKSTGKRKRVRKRKRRKRFDNTKEDISDANGDSRKFEKCQTYKGQEVDKNERGLYGCLPDKLEPPKYYRHGYRNLNSYAVEPNKHIKFDEDCAPEVTEESTKQFKFLCKPRKITDECVSDGKNESETVLDNKDAITTTTAYINGSFSTQSDSDALQNGEECHLSSQSESFTAMPFNYDDSSLDTNFDNTRNKSVAMETSPVTLERKTLSNGVSIFVRKRSSQASPYRGFSKQEQLDTKITNVSTIHLNPPLDEEFKVPSSPAPRLELSSKPCSHQVVNGFQMGAINLHDDFSGSNPLVGAPEVGDTIAYKVLEISATCTPEVSGYKVAKVLNVDDKQMLELKNLNQPDNPDKQITKFHVEIEDDNEILTNTEDQSDVVTLHLSSLLEPKIVSNA